MAGLQYETRSWQKSSFQSKTMPISRVRRAVSASLISAPAPPQRERPQAGVRVRQGLLGLRCECGGRRRLLLVETKAAAFALSGKGAGVTRWHHSPAAERGGGQRSKELEEKPARVISARSLHMQSQKWRRTTPRGRKARHKAEKKSAGNEEHGVKTKAGDNNENGRTTVATKLCLPGCVTLLTMSKAKPPMPFLSGRAPGR